MSANTEIKAKLPELLIFAKIFIIGILTVEIFNIAYSLGQASLPVFSYWPNLFDEFIVVIIALPLSLLYAYKRNVLSTIKLLIQSWRIDLLATFIFGAFANSFVEPLLSNMHEIIQQSNEWIALCILGILNIMLASSVIRAFAIEYQEKNNVRSQLLFMDDKPIQNEDEDHYSTREQAEAFARIVTESSSSQSGLVFGIDGPWGVGKSSFINLAQKYWESDTQERAIVFKFEPLRYATEADLSQRFIKELGITIQKHAYAPEFQPIASRYSRMLKGKAGFSFLGFKLSLEPSNETVDEMLEDIDEVLKRIKRRLIVVVDDLDRLEPKLINNVLFTIRRVYNLSQATYILCYDIDNLLLGKEAGEKTKAREFLEKFVTLQHSLFIDKAYIAKYLNEGWKEKQSTKITSSSKNILNVSSILTSLSAMLDGSKAAEYMIIIGDLRKIKRFINTLLLLKMETVDLDKTDFSRHSLINLLLLHLNYPNVFRRIYLEETDGYTGIFTNYNDPIIASDPPDLNSQHSPERHPLERYIEEQEPNAQFLIRQLFEDEDNDFFQESELEAASPSNRNSRELEKYLTLIVRHSIPEPRDTYILYWRAVERVKNNTNNKVSAIKEELAKSEFSLKKGDESHKKFWNILINESHNFNSIVVEDSINTLIELLPQYPSITVEEMANNQRSNLMYSMCRLLNNAGWEKVNSKRLANGRQNTVEISERIFGTEKHQGQGIITRLIPEERGALAWQDLLTFRLSCSADGGGQLHNLDSSLVLFEDINATTDGSVSSLTIRGMRRLSQEIVKLFKTRYINNGLNFLCEVDAVTDDAFLGEAAEYYRSQDSLKAKIAAARSRTKIFVTYQLCSTTPPKGNGVECGYYDEGGSEDSHGIAKIMNNYFLHLCFNPAIDENNIFHFVDHCLMSFEPYYGRESTFEPTENGLIGSFDTSLFIQYWRDNRDFILSKKLEDEERTIITSNYTTTYKQSLPKVYKVLEKMLQSEAVYADK